MTKEEEWAIKEVLKKVTTLDFQPELCANCQHDTYIITHRTMILSKFHKENNLGQDIRTEAHFRICEQCGQLFDQKVENDQKT